MKHYILIAIILFTYNLNAQVNNTILKDEFYFSYGQASLPQIGTALGAGLGMIIPNAIKVGLGADPCTVEITAMGSFSLGYNYHKNPRWSYGVTFTFEQIDEKYFSGNNLTAVNRNQFYTLMLQTDYRWVKKPRFQFYSNIAAGGSAIRSFEPSNLVEEKENRLTYAFQVNPIGLRFGNNFGFFLEGGFGWKGMLLAGFSTKF